MSQEVKICIAQNLGNIASRHYMFIDFNSK